MKSVESELLKSEFNTISSMFRQTDLAAVASTYLDLPTPFSSMGVFFPYAYPTGNMNSMY